MLKEVLGIREGILADLHDDHEEVGALMERILATKDQHERTELFHEMMSKFLAHAHAEQKVLYRKLEKSKDPEIRKFAFEGDVEHEAAENQVQVLAKARNKESEQWTARMTFLQEAILHHVKEEESTGFASAHKEFDRDQLEKLAEQFRREKEKLLATA